MPAGILAFTTSWCPDCHRSKRLMKRLGVQFTEIDIEAEDGAEDRMRALNGGSGKVPTIVIGGRILIEPSDADLTEALTGASAM